MDTDLLRDFVCLAKTLNYREASERLYISPSALTRRIHSLEASLGVTLFERNTRSVKLTPAGTACLSKAEEIIASFDEMLERAYLAESGEENELKVGYYETGNYPYVSALIKEMKRTHPLINLKMVEAEPEILRRDLLRGSLDALMMLKPTISDLPGLEYQTIKKESPCILLPENHSFASQETISIEQVKDENVFMFHREKSAQLYDMLLKVWTDTGNIPRLKNVPDQQISILVAAGEGILLCPSNEHNSIDTPAGTVRIPIEGEFTEFDRVLSWRKDNTGNTLKILRSVMAKISGQEQ